MPWLHMWVGNCYDWPTFSFECLCTQNHTQKYGLNTPSLVLRYLRGWKLGHLFSSLSFSMEPLSLIYWTSEAHRDSSSCFLREFSPKCVVGGSRALLHKGLFFLLNRHFWNFIHSFVVSITNPFIVLSFHVCDLHIYTYIHKTKCIHFLPKYVMNLYSTILI